MLDYKRLDVYRASLEFVDIALKLAARLPRGYATVADQLRRASSSIPLRIAEAAGRTSAAERAHGYAEARGEAMECGAALDIVRKLGGTPSEVDRGELLVERLVAMLTKMCR